MSIIYIRGYYLVMPNGDKHFIGTTKQAARIALESLPDVPSSWIDWCYGDTSSGEVGWVGVDQTDALHQGDVMMQFGGV